jgi:hypothetical protein
LVFDELLAVTEQLAKFTRQIILCSPEHSPKLALDVPPKIRNAATAQATPVQVELTRE